MSQQGITPPVIPCMRDTVTFRSIAGTSALPRLGLALAASALTHWALLSALLTDVSWRGAGPYAAGAPLTVRLAALPVPVLHVPAPPDPVVRPVTEGATRLRGEYSSSSTARAGTQAPALSSSADPIYYPARELDAYPRPLAPLDIEGLAGSGSGELRLALLIDERGIVRNITLESSAVPARLQEALRAALVATPFTPASKDGRAVRSRIVLSVNFAAAGDR